MGRGRCTFKQRDITRAIKGARAAGESVSRVEIAPDGKLVIITEVSGNTHEQDIAGGPGEANEWDGAE